jgi:regulatory protein
MVITKVERQKKNPSRVSIHIDNQYAIGVHKEVLLHSRLRAGDHVSEKTLDQLKKEEESYAAYQSASRLLSYRARSERELRQRLQKKGFGTESISRTIESLVRSGLVNDDEFARSFAHDKLLRKPMGKTMLVQQLRQKGISREVIQQTVEEAYRDVDEDQHAIELARSRFKRFRSTFAGLDPLRQKKKLSTYLLQRGFQWEAVRKAVTEVLGEIEF